MSLVLIFIECLVTVVLIIEVGTAARVSREASDITKLYSLVELCGFFG
jgi:hypothetical protein